MIKENGFELLCFFYFFFFFLFLFDNVCGRCAYQHVRFWPTCMKDSSETFVMLVCFGVGEAVYSQEKTYTFSILRNGWLVRWCHIGILQNVVFVVCVNVVAAVVLNVKKITSTGKKAFKNITRPKVSVWSSYIWCANAYGLRLVRRWSVFSLVINPSCHPKETGHQSIMPLGEFGNRPTMPLKRVWPRAHSSETSLDLKSSGHQKQLHEPAETTPE